MPRKEAKARGVYEKTPGSGVWWIRYQVDGQLHREKVGRRGDAIDLYKIRKAEILSGRKLPQNMRQQGLKFKALADDILQYSANHHQDKRNVKSRVSQILPDFADRIASAIKPSDIDNWIATHTSTAGTANRYRAVFSLIFREALRNGKVPSNPARLVRGAPAKGRQRTGTLSVAGRATQPMHRDRRDVRGASPRADNLCRYRHAQG